MYCGVILFHSMAKDRPATYNKNDKKIKNLKGSRDLRDSLYSNKK